MILRWMLSPAMRRVIAGRMRSRDHPERGRLSRPEASEIVRATWEKYEREARSLPMQPTFGSRLMVRLACATLLLFRELLAHDVDRRDALSMIEDTSWRLYGPLQRTSAVLARSAAADGESRIRARVAADHRFPFNPPGWRYEDKGHTGYDMVHCALAAYLLDEDAGDLCAAAFCAQDFAAAETWGLRLDRSKTLAQGHPVCDFRYHSAR